MRKNRRFFKVYLIAIAIGAILTVLSLIVRIPLDRSVLNSFLICFENKYTDVFLTQLSLTFITISLTSFLSEDNVTIYWRNVSEEKLIKPTWDCFYSLVIYTFSCVVFSGLALILQLKGLQLLLFCLDILLLMRLSIK